MISLTVDFQDEMGSLSVYIHNDFAHIGELDLQF